MIALVWYFIAHIIAHEGVKSHHQVAMMKDCVDDWSDWLQKGNHCLDFVMHFVVENNNVKLQNIYFQEKNGKMHYRGEKI